MTAGVVRTGVFTGRMFGIIVFAIIFILNIHLAFSDNSKGENDLEGMKLSFLNDVFGKEAMPRIGGPGSVNYVECATDYVHCTWNCGIHCSMIGSRKAKCITGFDFVRCENEWYVRCYFCYSACPG